MALPAVRRQDRFVTWPAGAGSRVIVRRWPTVPADVVLFSSLAAAAVLAILWLGRGHSFTGEESDFLQRQLDLNGLLRPHNEHLSTVPIVAYKVLGAAFGTGSYVPFLATLVGLHVAASAGLFALVRGRTGVAAAAVLLFLGSGYENLFWAFQIGFVSSVAAGLWAMKVRGGALAAVLLGVSLASSGIGLVFVLPVALLKGRRAIWLAIPLIAYGLWTAAYGQAPEHAGGLLSLVSWSVLGIGWAVGSIFGVGLAVGLGIAAALVVFARRGDRLVAAASSGLIVEYLLIGLARSGMELSSFSAAPRYVYVAAPFVLLAATGSVTDRRLLGCVLAAALIVNIVALPAGAAAW